MSFFNWFQCTFPLMDWKIGIFLWKSCSGLLLLIAIATIIPGKMHVWAGRIFRWPILLLTYLMILSELLVYVMVRLFIRLAEGIFTTKKHSMLRKGLNHASSYHEWYSIAKELDISMERDLWQNSLDDDTSYTYNWAFINELISDLRHARSTDDTMLALVVLRQCTRKNVGGVMNEDLFSATNTGEPKMIVQDFLQEVVYTLKWLTDKSRLPPFPTTDTDTETTTAVTKQETTETTATSTIDKKNFPIYSASDGSTCGESSSGIIVIDTSKNSSDDIQHANINYDDKSLDGTTEKDGHHNVSSSFFKKLH